MLPLPRGAVWQTFFLLCVVLLANEVRSEGRVVCYYTNWSVYRPGAAKFNPQNINPYLCTHLVYAFGGFTKDNTMKPFDKYQDIEQGGYAKFTGLKTYNKQLKTMIAIGGWNEASSRFSPLVANPERRHQFIRNILKFLRQNHFDGIDLDWEYPAHRDGGKARDKDNYAQFVEELRAEFDKESSKTGRPRLLLTMAVPAGIQYIEKGYDIPRLNKHLDWFNLLTYDFHSSHEPSANHHAPLYSMEEEDEYNFDSDLNIDYSVKYYLNAGADRNKLVLGIPTYGRSYTLFNEDSTDLGAPADGPGEQGNATREKGYLAYYEICQNIKEDPEWNVVQPNPKAMGPYAFRGNQWVGYDDEDIVRKKAEYVVENGLGGIMFWAIDNDDFRGTCTGKPYPLIEAAKEAYYDHLGVGANEVSKPTTKKKPLRNRNRIGSSSQNKVQEVVEKSVSLSRKRPATRKRPQTERPERPSTTTTTTGSSLYIGGRTTTPEPPTTPDPGSDFKCEDEGFFQHPRDCKKYFWCLDSGPSNLGIVAHQFTCPSGLYFNPAADSCDFARNVPCKKDTESKESKSTTAKPKTTTTTTARTTTASARITAATSRNTFTRFTTTTQAPDEEEEYEDEADESIVDSEEDPKVIKELIDLIKKVGGIEELEKHLLQQEDGTVMVKKDEYASSGGTTTPSSISKSLYDKVLSRPNNLNAFRDKFTSSSLFRNSNKGKQTVEEQEEETSKDKNSGSRYSSVVRNSRPGPQNAGIDKLPEFEGFLKEKKKYVTIQRTRPSTTDNEDDEEDDHVKSVQKDAEDENEDEEEEEEDIVKSSSRRPTSSSTPAYTSIRRTRPTTEKAIRLEDVEDGDDDDEVVVEKKTYSPVNRNRVRSTTEAVEIESTTVAGSRYKFLERSRPTRRTTPKEEATVDEDDEQQSVTVQYSEPNEISTQSPTQQQAQTTVRSYSSIGRRTTTPTTTTTDQDSITTTPESFVIDTTTPEPIIITTTTSTTTTTTTTNPTSIETSTQSSTTIPIQALSASTLNPIALSDDEEASTIAPKILNSLATETGLDTQELDSTRNQILTETTTIDETDRNEVTNLSSKTTSTTSDKSQSSLNSSSSSYNNSNSIRFTGGGGRRQQQQKQRTTTTTSTPTTTIQDTNQQDRNTNEFLGSVSSPRPFGFPRRRTRPTTTTTVSNGLDDGDVSSSTVLTSTDAAKPLVKKRIQFNRTSGRRRPFNIPRTSTTTTTTTATSATQVNESLDEDVVSSTSNLGLTSVKSGTTEDTETAAVVTSTEAADRKQRRRFRVLKFRRPVIVNNSLSVEVNNSTNTTTSSTDSVDNLSLDDELDTTINITTTTSEPPTPSRRFRKVIKKLRPVANRTVSENGTSNVLIGTRRPLNIAELFNKINLTTTTASVTVDLLSDGGENVTLTDNSTTEDTTNIPAEFDTTISEVGETVTPEETTSTTAAPPTPRRLLINRRPYRPTKPSINAITTTSKPTSDSTPKSYVRKFNRNFKAIRPPTDAANGVGFIQKVSERPQIGRNRFNFPTRTSTLRTVLRNPDENEDEEDYDEGAEEEEEEDEEEEVLDNQLVKSHNENNEIHYEEDGSEEDEEENEQEEDEQTEDEEEEGEIKPPSLTVVNRPSNRPTNRPLNRPVNLPSTNKPGNSPNRPSFNRPANTPSGSNRPSGPDSGYRYTADKRPSNKPRVVNRPAQITLPPNLLDSDKPSTPDIVTPPSVFVSTNTRSYERKYSATSTEAFPIDQSNPLLEDLNIDALNARNKKIFEVNSKKHTTIKPKIIQNDSQLTLNNTDTSITTNTSETITVSNTTDTPSDNFDTTTVINDDANNLINSQDDDLPVTTISTEVITDQPAPSIEGQLISYSPKKKLVSISRVVEINSKEEKLRKSSKDEQLKSVQSTELRSEGLPKLEPIGEISRVKFVHLVDGKDILVDGRSAVTDYTATEPNAFVRNTVPEVAPDSLENTGIEYIAGSTSAPVRNSIPDVDYSSVGVDSATDPSVDRKSKAITVPEVIADVVEASTISLEGLFDGSRKAKKINEAANEVNGIFYAYSLGEIPTTPKNEKPSAYTTTTPQTTLLTTIVLTTTTPMPTTTTTTSTSTAPPTTPTTTTPVAENTEISSETTIESTTIQPTIASPSNNRTYTRPIVPLLRPESNESPLVISIANLDKVILSKVLKSDSNSAPSVRQESVIEAPVKNSSTSEVLQTSESGGISSSSRNSVSSSSSTQIETKVQTETSFSSETHVVKRKKSSRRKHKSRKNRLQTTTDSSLEDATTIAP